MFQYPRICKRVFTAIHFIEIRRKAVEENIFLHVFISFLDLLYQQLLSLFVFWSNNFEIVVILKYNVCP